MVIRQLSPLFNFEIIVQVWNKKIYSEKILKNVLEDILENILKWIDERVSVEFNAGFSIRSKSEALAKVFKMMLYD